jgi:hypothetical protein
LLKVAVDIEQIGEHTTLTDTILAQFARVSIGCQWLIGIFIE